MSWKVVLDSELNSVDTEYHRVCEEILKNGEMIRNERTGKNCLTSYGHFMKFDLSKGFPLISTKKVLFSPVVSELIGFLRAYDNAADFRSLGCNIWDANANETESWLSNPNRKGHDDLGRIYGVQARKWNGINGEIDQLNNAINKIKKGIDDRGLIITHWNPAELNLMALRPCHLLYQFGIVGDRLDLCLYQRSADIPLGVPFNIASYALLLSIVAIMTGLKPGVFSHMMANTHVYEDQLEILRNVQMVRRSASMDLPKLVIDPRVCSLEDISHITPDMISIENYKHHSFIKYPFSA